MVFQTLRHCNRSRASRSIPPRILGRLREDGERSVWIPLGSMTIERCASEEHEELPGSSVNGITDVAIGFERHGEDVVSY